MLIAATLYALHLISFPAGWRPPSVFLDPRHWPEAAAIAANGAVAVILGDERTPIMLSVPQRLLVVRADGSTTMLRAQSREATHAFARYLGAQGCLTAAANCPYFSGVALASDGTPFVTLSMHFDGAYSGNAKAVLVWDGVWHSVPDRLPFSNVPGQMEVTNVSIAAASTRSSFAFVGDYDDAIPDLDDRNDPHSQADVSGAILDVRSIALGFGNATAMRGRFVAGFDAALRTIGEPGPPVALRWDCAESVVATRRCARVALGPGVAYGVDSEGEVVGDDEAFSDGRIQSAPGRPVLWRNRVPLKLSSEHGSAYAISEDGTIVGATWPSYAGAYRGFVADSRSRSPQARPLDPLVTNLRGRHVLAAFGISDSGRILALVGDVRPTRSWQSSCREARRAVPESTPTTFCDTLRNLGSVPPADVPRRAL